MGRTNWKTNKWTKRLLVWGRPFIRSLIMDILVPMIQERVNAGAIDTAVDNKIRNAAAEFCKNRL